jgi:hypothetical protein
MIVMSTVLSYDEACEILRPLAETSLTKIIFPTQEDISAIFINEELSSLAIGDTSYISETKEAILTIYRYAIKNSQNT